MSKDKLLIHLDYCLTPSTRINNAAIVIENGFIQSLGGISAYVHKENFDIIEMTDCHAVPGFIDTRLYGAAKFDCMHADSSIDNINDMSRVLAEHGVTSFLPTTQSSSHAHLLSVIEALANKVGDESLPGAVPVGLHIEGPYISPERPGAHQVRYIQPIDLGKAREIIEAGKGKIKVFTFAPELDGAIQLIELLRENNIMPCMGHTMADQEQVMAAIEAGALRCSHLYNGMEPLNQRKVGLAAISMVDERMWVELIPDGVHSHWGMLNLACRSKNKDKIICISNSTEAAGLADGKYHLGDRVINVHDHQVTLEDGTIAGSANFLDQNFRNILSHADLKKEETVASFTLNPALSIGARERGKIKPGKRADLVIMDEQNHIQMTIVNGRIAYSKREPVFS